MSINKYPSYMLAVGGWRRAGALLYRLTGEHRPTNFDEIRVTMANGSRDIGQMSAQAERLLVMLTAPQPAAQAAPTFAAKLPSPANVGTAPKCLNLNDQAMWVLGWNECLDAAIAAQKGSHD